MNQYGCGDMISRQEFNALTHHSEPLSCSIYMPTHRHGVEVQEQHDAILFKKLVGDLENQIRNELSEAQTEKYLASLKKLINDTQFWRNQSEGLAVFYNQHILNYYHLPVAIQPKIYLSDHFNLYPLMPIMQQVHTFYILKLRINNTKLYKANQYGMTSIPIEEYVPETLWESVGYDYEDNSLRFASGKGQYGTGQQFHGHGEGDDIQDKEIEKHLREIDKGIMEWLKDKNEPLMLAGSEHIAGLYKNISHYRNIRDHLLGNIDEDSVDDYEQKLHTDALEAMKPYLDQQWKNSVERYRTLAPRNMASNEIRQIIPEAYAGRIEQLLINGSHEIFGHADQKDYGIEVRVDEGQTYNNISLTNIAAIQTYLQNGEVMVLAEEQMPAQGTPLNAIYRY